MLKEGMPAGTELFHQQPAALSPELLEKQEIDKPQDECGVFGIYAPGEDIGMIGLIGNIMQEHRGRSAAGISFNHPTEHRMVTHKGLGRMIEAVPELMPQHGLMPLDLLKPDSLIAQTRYNTAPSNAVEAAQPFDNEHLGGNEPEFALAMNGNIEGLDVLARRFRIDVAEAPSDTAKLAKIIVERLAVHDDIKDTLKEVLPRVRGSYCLTIDYKGSMIGVRDPWGVHPLSLAVFPNGKHAAVASEDVGFRGYEFDKENIRDIAPGEAVIVNENGIESFQAVRPRQVLHCLYEHIYIADKDSTVNGSYTYEARKNMGRRLVEAQTEPIKATMVVPVPDSAVPVAEGISEASGIPLVAAIKKNPNAGRTFILRGEARKKALAEKFEIDVEALEGEDVLLAEDSTIKGNTVRQVVEQLEEAGVRSITLFLAGPRYESICNLGLDTSEMSELIAQKERSNEEIAKLLRVKAVYFNSFEDTERAIDDARADPKSASLIGKFCRGCSFGEYPIKTPDALQQTNPKQLGEKVLAVVSA